MARASRPAGSVKSYKKNDQRPGARLVPVTLLAGLGLAVSLGVMAMLLSAHGAFMFRGADNTASAEPGPGERRISLALLSPAVGREAEQRSPKYPRMPDLDDTAWKATDMDEG